MGGIEFGESNAKKITDLRGPFATGGGFAGWGPAVGPGGYVGNSPDGTVIGGDIVIGGGAGGGLGGGGTWTWILPTPQHPTPQNP
jgi:hypothetical protein